MLSPKTHFIGIILVPITHNLFFFILNYFIFVLGTHDIHALILGRAITGLNAF